MRKERGNDYEEKNRGVITAKKNGTAKITVVSGKKKVIVTVKVTK